MCGTARYISVVINETNVPMEKTTTQLHVDSGRETSVKGPRKSTVDFIKQFARIYTCSTVLPLGLGSMIVN